VHRTKKRHPPRRWVVEVATPGSIVSTNCWCIMRKPIAHTLRSICSPPRPSAFGVNQRHGFTSVRQAQFGLSEINWGILPGGGTTKVASELLSFRRAMYQALLGESVDGRRAAEWGLVNESLPLPLAQVHARVDQVAHLLLQKSAVALKATKHALRRVREMTYDNAEDYLIRAQEVANSFDAEGRKEGIRQFIDDKSYKSGLGHYAKTHAGST